MGVSTPSPIIFPPPPASTLSSSFTSPASATIFVSTPTQNEALPAIIGGIVGFVLCIALLLLVLFFVRRRNRQRRSRGAVSVTSAAYASGDVPMNATVPNDNYSTQAEGY